ncbi:hypothetical protein ACLOJK_032135 [Asimina triloba]
MIYRKIAANLLLENLQNASTLFHWNSVRPSPALACRPSVSDSDQSDIGGNRCSDDDDSGLWPSNTSPMNIGLELLAQAGGPPTAGIETPLTKTTVSKKVTYPKLDEDTEQTEETPAHEEGLKELHLALESCNEISSAT